MCGLGTGPAGLPGQPLPASGRMLAERPARGQGRGCQRRQRRQGRPSRAKPSQAKRQAGRWGAVGGALLGGRSQVLRPLALAAATPATRATPTADPRRPPWRLGQAADARRLGGGRRGAECQGGAGRPGTSILRLLFTQRAPFAPSFLPVGRGWAGRRATSKQKGPS